LGQFSGSNATDRLRAVIEENQKATKRQTAIMIWLTWVMTALTVITGSQAGRRGGGLGCCLPLPAGARTRSLSLVFIHAIHLSQL
jgi:hypothetical protein